MKKFIFCILVVVFAAQVHVSAEVFKVVDDKREQSLPRSLSDVDFHKWLSSARAKDKAMVYKKLTITINK